MKIFLFKFIHVCFFTYVLFLIVLFFAQRTLIYHPDKSTPIPIKGIEIVKVKTSDGLNLEGWYIPGSDPKGKTILFFHGNAGHYGDRFGKALEFTGNGYNVLLVGYRGYGGNEGYPSEEGLYSDARAYIKFLTDEKNIPVEDVILYGESLGTGVAVQIATEYPVSSLIFETPYSSLYEIAKKDYFFVPVVYMLKDRFMSTDKIGKISCPLLILHGEKDTIIPLVFSKKLFDKAREPKTFIEFPEGTHHNLYQLGASRKILDFLSQTLKNDAEH